MMIGIYGMAIGLLKLGFLLNFISIPILDGFISAIATTIILNQMGSLLGEPSVGHGAAAQIHGIFYQLPRANGYTCAIGFTSIFLLTAMDQAGKRWGKKNRIVWFLSITRAFIVLVIYTGVGYAVNKGRGDPANFLFEVTEVKANGQEAPRMPDATLLTLVASRSVAVFVGSAIEHTAIARAFGAKNNYATDQSQELTFYGVTNFANSFFHAVGVGGAMSRTAVNSACNVKSPLSGFVTTGIVLLSIFKLVGTLYWIPKATLAAIIITAVWPLISPPSVFYSYWRTSLADFTSSMMAFWVSLFVSTQIGIASAVGFNILYILLRHVFIGVSIALPQTTASPHGIPDMPSPIPPDVRVFRFDDSVFFPNAYRAKSSIVDAIRTYHAPGSSNDAHPNAGHNWDVVGERRIAKLRRCAGISDHSSLPPIGIVVVDFSRVSYIDTTACIHLKELITDIKGYGGSSVKICFAGISNNVQQRLERAGWNIIRDVDVDGDSEAVRVFSRVADAVNVSR